VCPKGNHPTQSKHQLLTTWPHPELVRDIAKFIRFVQFYSKFIHHFELRVTPLRELVTNNEYVDPVAPIWTEATQRAMDDLKESILSDPCLMRFDHNRLVVLRTDFSSAGFGYVVCQPGMDEASERAMAAFQVGQDFMFMSKDSSAVLRPVAFGSRRCQGNEVRLHSHLGEGFAGNWAINKNCHYLFGTQFVWVTDCYAIRFILSYDGNNPAILCLQMRLMCWDVTIVHQNDSHLADADYWSHLGEDICFNPHFQAYLQYVLLRATYPAPTELPMLPQHMPYYRGPRVALQLETPPSDADATYCQGLLSTIIQGNIGGRSHLSNVSIRFGDFDSVTPADAHASNNHEIPCLAGQILRFRWAVYSFGGGHFSSTIISRNLPFCVSLACDQYKSGHALFREFTSCNTIFASGTEMLNYIRGSGDVSQIHGYLIHSLCFKDSETTSTFSQLQGTIVSQLRMLRDLQVVVAIVLSDHNSRCVTSFVRTINSNGWKILKHDISFPAQGNSVAGACHIIIGIHSSCASTAQPLLLKEAPPTSPQPLGSFLWEPFNRTDYSVSLAKDDDDFCCQDVRFTASTTVPTGVLRGILIRYFLHHPNSDENLTGTSVVSTEGLCPPFDACPNTNLFQHLYGIKFAYEGHLCVRGISPFEFACCFGFTDDLTYRLSHLKNKFCLDGAIPGRTSSWLFKQIHAHLVFLRDSNCEIMSPDQYAAPAATIQAFVNGAIGSRLPSQDCWIKAYSDDPECSTLRHLVENPGSICKEALKDVHYCYCHPLRQSLLFIEDGMLIYREPIHGS
jgi:hypothetical protein